LLIFFPFVQLKSTLNVTMSHNAPQQFPLPERTHGGGGAGGPRPAQGLVNWNRRAVPGVLGNALPADLTNLPIQQRIAVKQQELERRLRDMIQRLKNERPGAANDEALAAKIEYLQGLAGLAPDN